MPQETILTASGPRIYAETISEDGNVHRRSIDPGRLESGFFAPTDLTGEDQAIKDLAAETWTPEIVAAWQDWLLVNYASDEAPTVPMSVSARQFKLQLLASGLLSQVEAFIASQGQAVQIAYGNSGSFVRSEPMMQSGFAALGFTAEQIDAFFEAAAKL